MCPQVVSSGHVLTLLDVWNSHMFKGRISIKVFFFLISRRLSPPRQRTQYNNQMLLPLLAQAPKLAQALFETREALNKILPFAGIRVQSTVKGNVWQLVHLPIMLCARKL